MALFESADGFDWRPSRHVFVANPAAIEVPGRGRLQALERPQVYRDEKGDPAALFCAAADTEDRATSFNVAIPLRRPS